MIFKSMSNAKTQSDIFDLTNKESLLNFEVRKAKNDMYYLHNPVTCWPCRSFILSKNKNSYILVEVSFSENKDRLLPEFKFSRHNIKDNSIQSLGANAKEDKLGLVDLGENGSQNFWDLIACLSKCQNVDTTNFKRHKILESDKVIEINDQNFKEIIQQLIDKNYSEDALIKIIEHNFDLAEAIAKSTFQKQREKELNEFKQMLKQNCSDETGKWQPFFERCKWIFGLGLNYKFLLKFKRELKTGLGDEEDKGQSFTDFGLGVLDEYSILVELKTPDAEIFMASEGDSNTWKISQKLANSLVQVLSQKTAWVSNIKNKFPVDPRCILIYGNTNQIDNEIKKATFEMFRRDSRNIEVITYDELFKRAYYIVNGTPMFDDYLQLKIKKHKTTI